MNFAKFMNGNIPLCYGTPTPEKHPGVMEQDFKTKRTPQTKQKTKRASKATYMSHQTIFSNALHEELIKLLIPSLYLIFFPVFNLQHRSPCSPQKRVLPFPCQNS